MLHVLAVYHMCLLGTFGYGVPLLKFNPLKLHVVLYYDLNMCIDDSR